MKDKTNRQEGGKFRTCAARPRHRAMRAGFAAGILAIAALVMGSYFGFGSFLAAAYHQDSPHAAQDASREVATAPGGTGSTADIEYLFGRSVSGNSDLDGDGISDFIVGAPYLHVSGVADAGGVYVFSGSDSSLITTLYGESSLDHFGFSVSCIGDANGDGIADFLVGAPGWSNNTGRAYVYSGHTFALLHSFDGENPGNLFGFSASHAGDLDQDDLNDIIIGAPGAESGKGRIYAYLGGTWYQKFSRSGDAAGDSLGYSVSGAGRVNLNGTDDVIVSAPYFDGVFGPNNGRAYVLDGNSSGDQVIDLCWQFGDAPNAHFGWSVSDLGDCDLDDKVEFLVGSPGLNDNTGAVYVLRCSALCLGGLCTVVHTFTGEAQGDRFGHAVALAGDVDHDSEPDIVIGAPNADGNRGKAYIYRCDEWDLYCSTTGRYSCDRFGFSVACAGDVGARDGDDDIIIGAIYANCSGLRSSGKAYVQSGDDCAQLYEHDPHLPGLSITQPSQTDPACAGELDTIIWSNPYAYLAPWIKIAYSTNGGTHWSDWTTIPNSGSYVWTPTCADFSDDCSIHLCTKLEYVCDTSEQFSIAKPCLEIAQPAAGASLAAGSHAPMQWNDICCGLRYEFVWLNYSCDSGKTWSDSLALENTGQSTWVVPYKCSDSCLMALGTPGGCSSDTVAFRIVPPNCFCGALWGDLSNDGAINPVDVVIIVNLVYKLIDRRVYPSCWNCPRGMGDVNCDGAINPVDVVLYVNCVYKGKCGPENRWCANPCGP